MNTNSIDQCFTGMQVKENQKMKRIYSIPEFFYNKKIYDYISNLIDNGAKNYQSLDNLEKDNIVIRIIEVLGDDAYEILIGDNVSKVLSCLTRYLKKSDTLDMYDLAEQLRKNAIEHFSFDLEELFTEIIQSKLADGYQDNGFVSTIDNVNGEAQWRLFI